MNDAALAKKQGVTRQAIHRRRKAGWTEQEILAGKRAKRTRPLAGKHAKILGRPVAEAAKDEGVTVQEMHRRIRRDLGGIE